MSGIAISLALLAGAESVYADLVLPDPQNQPIGDVRATSTEIKDYLKNTSTILIDVRGSRGGKGDVAAGFLTAEDLVKRHRYAGKIIFLMDDSSQKILNKLYGNSIKAGSALRSKRIQFYTIESLPSMKRPIDLYLSLAGIDGTPKFNNDLFWTLKQTSPPAGKIPIDEKSILIYQSVLGNTENTAIEFSKATLQTGRISFEVPTAGIGPNESGMYLDPVAVKLRGKSDRVVRDFVKKELNKMDGSVATFLRNIVDREALTGSKFGLVYGITHADVKPQFAKYLRALADEAKLTGASFTLVTPSGFDLHQIHDGPLASHIEVISLSEPGAQLPAQAKPGKIYVVKTGALPHPVFTGLLAHSAIPPIVAGDGAMSAAIAIGKPFLMTQVGWNKKNIAHFRTLLSKALSQYPKATEVLKAYEKSDLAIVNQIQSKEYREAFKEVFQSTPRLTDEMISQGLEARRLLLAPMDLTEVIQLKNPLFKVKKLSDLILGGNQEALPYLLQTLIQHPSAYYDGVKHSFIAQEFLDLPLVRQISFSSMNSLSEYRARTYRGLQKTLGDQALGIFKAGLIQDTEPEALIAILEEGYALEGAQQREFRRALSEAVVNARPEVIEAISKLDFYSPGNEVRQELLRQIVKGGDSYALSKIALNSLNHPEVVKMEPLLRELAQKLMTEGNDRVFNFVSNIFRNNWSAPLEPLLVEILERSPPKEVESLLKTIYINRTAGPSLLTDAVMTGLSRLPQNQLPGMIGKIWSEKSRGVAMTEKILRELATMGDSSVWGNLIELMKGSPIPEDLVLNFARFGSVDVKHQLIVHVFSKQKSMANLEAMKEVINSSPRSASSWLEYMRHFSSPEFQSLHRLALDQIVLHPLFSDHMALAVSTFLQEPHTVIFAEQVAELMTRDNRVFKRLLESKVFTLPHWQGNEFSYLREALALGNPVERARWLRQGQGPRAPARIPCTIQELILGY